VRGGAKIGAALVDQWVEWNLERITPAGDAPSADGRGQMYEVRTRDGAVIYWGHEPDAEAEGEPATHQKIATLSEFIATRQAGGESAGPHELDLRQGGAASRTARRSGVHD
jgi:hypothetical protein